MNELTVKGKQEFMGKEIPVIYGGFGAGQKVILAKDIALIHNMKSYHVNENINKNIKRFKENIDIIDLKVALGMNDSEILFRLGFTQNMINASKNIYLLSERGYYKLIKILDSELAWEIHDKLMDEYFQLREQKEYRTPLTTDMSYEQAILELHELTGYDKDKTMNILRGLQGQQPGELTNNNPKQSDRPIYVPRYYSTTELANSGLTKYTTTMSLHKALKEKGILTNRKNKPYQKYINEGYFTYGIIMEYDEYDYKQEPVRRKGWILTPKGWEWIIQLLRED